MSLHIVLTDCIFLWCVCSKGISKSALPYRRSIATWLKASSEDVKDHIFKLAKKGLTPSKIGNCSVPWYSQRFIQVLIVVTMFRSKLRSKPQFCSWFLPWLQYCFLVGGFAQEKNVEVKCRFWLTSQCTSDLFTLSCYSMTLKT